mmetsp:Transcript_30013/g.70694  ORF Transcript_30013/g.70694 Transcript_30013/m.70694 type:complete len:96 (-) Transcript_30013:10-297(-)
MSRPGKREDLQKRTGALRECVRFPLRGSVVFVVGDPRPKNRGSTAGTPEQPEVTGSKRLKEDALRQRSRMKSPRQKSNSPRCFAMAISAWVRSRV